MKTKLFKVLSMLLVMALLSQLAVFNAFAAPEMLPLYAPENLKVEAKEPGKPAIGFISSKECYVDIIWNESSISPYPAQTFYNIYIREINKYGIGSVFTLRETEKGLPANINKNPYRITNLKPGTSYQIMVKSYYRVTDQNTVYTSVESSASNVIDVLTDISLTVGPPAGTNHIRVQWDDVWTLKGRIDYKLYISENSNFANTQPIYISKNMIGAAGPIFVNQTAGKLEYTHPVRDPGKIYYVKLAPDINDSELYKTPETRTEYINTFIMVKTTRVANTPSGILWRLDWTPVNTGLSVELSKAYLIYKGIIGSTAAPDYVATVTGDTSFFVTVPVGDKSTYFKIVADIRDKSTQQEVFPIRITSDDILVKEADIPNTPPVPELSGEIRDDSGQVAASYSNLLGSDTATILWKVQRKADGSIDTDIEYDIWLIGDEKYIENPPASAKIADSFKIDINNENFIVRDVKGDIIGYKYKLTGLTPNGTYYFKVIAKKRFVDLVDGELADIVLQSDPAYWVVITRPRGPIEQPVVPIKPPLKIKIQKDGTEAVTSNSVIIQLKNKWYEKYDPAASRWSYIDTGILTDPTVGQTVKNQLLVLIESIDAGTADRSKYRKVEYDEGVGIDVGCIKESELTSYDDLSKIPAEKIVDFPTMPNDPDEIPDIPGDSKHNIDIPISGLETNSSYIIWVKAVRRAAGTAYEPSDPIIVITRPELPQYPEYPTVPMFNYGVASDRYVDVGWTQFRPEYTYHLAWSTIDDINSIQKQVTVKAQDYEYYYYRVDGLLSGTGYYFWVRAESKDAEGKSIFSEWSDSYLINTLPDLPPKPPRGFGIGNFEGAVGKNSISFEWIKENNIEYILEIATNPEFKQPILFQAGEAGKYTVVGLRSNLRYYARLYAYDKDKKLQSAPSPVITVRTERSTDDYDSDQNTEDILAGEFIEKDAYSIGRTWNIRLSGVNADRFIEHAMKDNNLDYRLNVKNTPAYTERVSLTVSSRVIDSLSNLKENLIIETAENELVIRPYMLLANQSGELGTKPGYFDYKITISLPHQLTNTRELSFHSRGTSILIEAYNGANLLPVNVLNKPLKLLFNYNGSWYKEGVTSGYVYNNRLNKWEKCVSTSLIQNNLKKYIAVESLKPGEIGVASFLEAGFDDLAGQPLNIRQAVKNVSSIHKLKSIEGTSFKPALNAVLGDTVKFMLDMLDYNYDASYMATAAKAGIIQPGDIIASTTYCTREKAAAMAARVYEIKTYSSAAGAASGLERFTDLGTIAPELRNRVYFALNNGILPLAVNNRIDPNGLITRAEVMLILERVLALAGELDG